MLSRQERVLSQLSLDSLREALPVKVTYELLELTLVELISTFHSRHVRLNQVILRHVAGKDEAGTWHVLDSVEDTLQAVHQVELLDLEARLLLDTAALSLGLVE